MVTDRIVLEAKRLLVHSLLPVANIGYELGFSEATNFVKFFHRGTRQTPGAFRAQMLRATGGRESGGRESGGRADRSAARDADNSTRQVPGHPGNPG